MPRPESDRAIIPGRPVNKPPTGRPVWHRHTLDRDSTGSRPFNGVHMTGYTQPLGERECKKLFQSEFDRWSTGKPPPSTGHRQPLGERESKEDFWPVFDRISTNTQPVTTSHWERECVKKCAPPALDRGSTYTRSGIDRHSTGRPDSSIGHTQLLGERENDKRYCDRWSTGWNDQVDQSLNRARNSTTDRTTFAIVFAMKK